MTTNLMMMYRTGRELPWIMWQRTTHCGEVIDDLFYKEYKSQQEAIKAANKLNIVPPMAWKQAGGGDLWEGPRITVSAGRR